MRSAKTAPPPRPPVPEPDCRTVVITSNTEPFKASQPALPADAVLFDLDGTLIDTAGGICHALNRVLRRNGLAEVSLEVTRSQVSHGAFNLVEKALAATGDEQDAGERIAELRDEFLEAYKDSLLHDTRLYPGIPELLAELGQRRIPWGIVTNKSERFVYPLLQAFALEATNGCIVCGDTTPYLKPDPAPLLEAGRRLGLARQAALVYLGDAEKDMLAARRAGMNGVIARYGYIDPAVDLDGWKAAHAITAPLELVNCLGPAR